MGDQAEKLAAAGASFELSEVAVGNTVRVVSVAEGSRVGKRLMEMGFGPGVNVRVIKAAPFGDPIEVRLRGYNLALRRSEASAVTVEV